MCRLFNENGDEVLYEEVRKAMGDDLYPMSLTGRWAEAVKQAVNIGIDAHLEACFIREFGDSYEVNDRKVGDKVLTRALDCKVSKESMPVLLRRLFEIEGDLQEPASSLASDILDSLGMRGGD